MRALATLENFELKRDEIVQESNAVHLIPLTNARVWNAPQTLPPNPSAADDLGMYSGAFGTGVFYLGTYDVKSSGGAQTLYTRFPEVQLPPWYVTGGAASLRFAAGMLGAVADNDVTLDVEAYLSARTTLKSGSDLVSTGAQSINSLTFANYTFTLNPTTLAKGGVMDIRLTVVTNDAAGGTPLYAAITHFELLLDIQG